MTLTYDNIINSLAGKIKNLFTDDSGEPLYPVYDSATANTVYPCFFIFPVRVSMNEEINDRFIREVSLDIVFVQQRNLTSSNALLFEIAETLDYNIDVFDYSDNTDTCPMLVHERSWEITDQELHYKATLKPRVAYPTTHNYMQTEASNVGIKDSD